MAATPIVSSPTVKVAVELPKSAYDLIAELVKIDGSDRTVESFIAAEVQFHLAVNLLDDVEFLGRRVVGYLCKKHGFEKDRFGRLEERQ